MPAFFQNGVLNEGNTPAAKTGTLAARQSAATVAEGTVYIAYDTQEIFSAQGGNWVKVSGGGGGSQNLDQVLAVGDSANSKSLILNGISYSNILRLVGASLDFLINADSLNFSYNTGPRTKGYRFFCDFLNQAFRITNLPASNGVECKLIYENDDNGKNVFYIETSQGISGEYKRFYIDKGNDVSIADVANTDIAEVKHEANLSVPEARTRNTVAIAGDTFYTEVRQQGFEFKNTQESAFVSTVLPSYGGSGHLTYFPQFSGLMANVNEWIRASGIILNSVSFDCQVYGAYHVKTGSNTNDFDLTNFVNNGTDGQFVTILAQDTPIRCVNTAGQVYGTANINSKGLFKLMKFGNDIYSSHL